MFETSKTFTVPADCNDTIALVDVKMDFMVNSYNPERPNDFRIRISKNIDKRKAKEVGEYMLDSNNYIDQYNISENGAFDLSFELS